MTSQEYTQIIRQAEIARAKFLRTESARLFRWIASIFAPRRAAKAA